MATVLVSFTRSFVVAAVLALVASSAMAAVEDRPSSHNAIERSSFYPLYDGRCSWRRPNVDEGATSYVIRHQRSEKTVEMDFDCIDAYFNTQEPLELRTGDLVLKLNRTVRSIIEGRNPDVCFSGFAWLDWAAEAYQIGRLSNPEGPLDVSAIQFAAAVVSEGCGGNVRAVQLFGRAVEMGWVQADGRIRSIDQRTLGQYPSPPGVAER